MVQANIRAKDQHLIDIKGRQRSFKPFDIEQADGESPVSRQTETKTHSECIYYVIKQSDLSLEQH